MPKQQEGYIVELRRVGMVSASHGDAGAGRRSGCQTRAMKCDVSARARRNAASHRRRKAVDPRAPLAHTDRQAARRAPHRSGRCGGLQRLAARSPPQCDAACPRVAKYTCEARSQGRIEVRPAGRYCRGGRGVTSSRRIIARRAGGVPGKNIHGGHGAAASAIQSPNTSRVPPSRARAHARRREGAVAFCPASQEVAGSARQAFRA